MSPFRLKMSPFTLVIRGYDSCGKGFGTAITFGVGIFEESLASVSASLLGLDFFIEAKFLPMHRAGAF